MEKLIHTGISNFLLQPLDHGWSLIEPSSDIVFLTAFGSKILCIPIKK
jgi:hypothetical protein